MRVVLGVAEPAIARELRDLGAEVVVVDGTDPAALVSAAVQEDADVIGATGPAEAITGLLADNGAAEVAVVDVLRIAAWVVDTAGERAHHRS